MSQIESRILLMYTRDKKCIEMARAKPDEFDMHVWAAARIFGVSEKSVNKDQRFFGKMTNHAAQGGMKGAKMSDELIKLDIVRTPEECQRMLDAYHAALPAIEGVYFSDIRKQIFRYRCVSNTWGRVLRFEFERLGDDIYRQGYRFPPQSDAADLLNQWGLVPLHKYVQAIPPKAHINIQAHDALLVSCWPHDAFHIACFLRDSLERPRIYLNEPMTVPVTFKLGSTWKGDFEFKRLPSEKEFTEAAFACEEKRHG